MTTFPVGLVGYYQFEDASKANGAPCTDSSGYGNDGIYKPGTVVTGSPSTISDVAGYSGRAVYMDTPQAYPNNDSPTLGAAIKIDGLAGLGGYSQTFGIEMRLNVGSLDATYNRGLAGVGNTTGGVLGWAVYVNTLGKLGFVLGSAGGNGGLGNPAALILTPTAIFPNSGFLKVLCLYNSVTHIAKIWVADVLVASQSVPATFSAQSLPLYIGGAYLEFAVGQGSFKHCKDTTFDEVKVYTFVAPPSRAVIINTSIGRDGPST